MCRLDPSNGIFTALTDSLRVLSLSWLVPICPCAYSRLVPVIIYLALTIHRRSSFRQRKNREASGCCRIDIGAHVAGCFPGQVGPCSSGEKSITIYCSVNPLGQFMRPYQFYGNYSMMVSCSLIGESQPIIA